MMHYNLIYYSKAVIWDIASLLVKQDTKVKLSCKVMKRQRYYLQLLINWDHQWEVIILGFKSTGIKE